MNFGKIKFGIKINGINDIKNKVKAIIVSSQSYELEIYDRIKYIKREGIDIICMYLDCDKIIKEKKRCKTEGFSINVGGGN